jgi:hypothetical protein
MATTVSELIAKLGLDNADFLKKMDDSISKMQDFGKKMTDVGKSLSLGLTAPLTAMAAVSVKAFDVQAKAEARLTAAMRANGEVAEGNLQRYQELASRLQAITNVGDETTLGLIASAQTMGLTGDAAFVAAKNAVGLSKALGIGMDAALKMSAQAMQGNYDLLARQVPALRNATTEAEKAAIAQQFFASTMEQATAMATTGLGPLEGLQGAIGDLMEKFGEIIAEAINPFIQRLQAFVERLQQVDKSTLKWIIGIGALAAALGPILVTIGFFVGTILPKLILGIKAVTAVFSVLSIKILAIIAVVAALAAGVLYLWYNWDAVMENMRAITQRVINFILEGFGKLYDFIAKGARAVGLDSLADQMANVGAKVRDLKKEVPAVNTAFKSFGDTMKEVWSDVQNLIPTLEKKSDTFEDLEVTVTQAAQGSGQAIQRLTATAIEGARGLGVLGAGLTMTAEKMKLSKVAIVEYLQPFTPLLQNVGFLNQALAGTQNFMEGLFGTMLNGGNAFEFIFRMIKQLVAQLAAAAAMAFLLKMALPFGNFTSFVSQAGGTGFADFFKMFANIPRFATGGITTGPTLAMVGDNPSGREAIIPFERMGEFMRMAGAGQGSQNITVSGVIRSGDIWLSNQQAQSNLVRRLGV